MTRRQIRKAVARGMLNDGKKPEMVLKCYRVVILMEVYGYTFQEAKKRIGVNKWTLSRHTMNLFFLRRSMIQASMEGVKCGSKSKRTA